MAISSRPRRRGLRSTLAVLLVLALAAFAFAWRAPIARVATPATASFDAATVHRGARLAAMGNCVSCHTTGDGAAFAGGRGLPTPFGTVFATNITPDGETGIGGWSEAAFMRALREGVSRDGHLLYPAFPYDHFTRLADGDIHALYAYLMTRTPVHAVAPANRLTFPLQFRPLLAGWNLLFLQQGPRTQTASGEAGRGAYLVEALAHCSACHSPRNRLGAEQHDRFLAGGEAEGWHASALNGQSESPLPWSTEALAAYLRTGLVPGHAMTAGPMQDVVRSQSEVDPADVHAIATYITGAMGPPSPERQTREAAARQRAQGPLHQDGSPGARLYADNCAACHDAGRGLSSNSALRLPLAVALYMPDPRNLLHIVRQGIQPVAGRPGRWMPPFEGTLNEEQLATLADWLRREATGEPPWTDLARALQDTRPPTP
ncbi:c-type cytochrome [Ramlibacter sp.]|uniref:c-type cytochrome n=1 Tax=Ramlibacter sp. TaxID=1917967 RepID=UPI00262AFE97|nr:c-type cytochrome [Ramlibacter sp.]MDB5954510.1 putative alcohol dehydrogenase cytochrome c subunit precursor protein [Ramlibacter sp.]